MFHEGNTGSAVSLDSLLPSPDLYAVGALADLAGEVTILGGEAFLSYPDGDATRTIRVRVTDEDATLLAAATVPDWNAAETDHSIPFDKLDDAIAKLGVANGMNPGEAFPFLMEGTFEDLQWHVIDGSKLIDGGQSHEEHLAAGIKMRRDRVAATLIGFYSETDQGVFTHMGSRTHVHCALTDPLAGGHVEHVTIPAGTTIRFPSR